MEIDIYRILTFCSLLLLLWPFFISLKGQSSISKYISAFFFARILVESLGITSKLFSWNLHIQYHIYSFFEFQILLLVYYKITNTKTYKPIALIYSVIWISLRFVDIEVFAENFSKSVNFTVWINSVVMILFYGIFLLRFNFKNGIKNTYSVLALAILSYFIIICTFILYNQSITYSEIPRMIKKELIKERYLWHTSFVMLSTILFAIGIMILPKKKNIEEEKSKLTQ